ncbi:C-reactive protein-like [Podarcis raffonei]|uniref:C-reactive protein-like n=1 Tax=Podarcis raffonei TaxID=65483 RepID=UPI0023294646|nr:C-reactive protein-like [Podarcis raffonei]
MKMLLFFCFFLLLNACQSFGQQASGSGLSGKQVVFAQASNTAHVVLKASPKQPLTAFTVCLKHYTDLTRAYSLFSYATQNSHNDIIIYKHKPNQYSFYVGGEAVTFLTPEKQSLERETLCASWDSATGLARLWVNGKRLPPRSLKKGYSISADSSIVLGQDQDNMGGGFDINDSYVGELLDVRMWERELSQEEMKRALLDDNIPGNAIFDWETVNYEAKGGVIIERAWSP